MFSCFLLAHFSSTVHVYTPRKRQKTKSFLMFLGDIETKHWPKRVNLTKCLKVYADVKCNWSLTSSIQYANNECLKITGIHLKLVYLVKLLSNRSATLSPKNLENPSNFEGWCLNLVAYKKGVYFLIVFIVNFEQVYFTTTYSFIIMTVWKGNCN